MPLKRGEVLANHKYLKKWDEYKEEWPTMADFDANKPLLLPIVVDIDGGEIQRDRISAPALTTILEDAEKIVKDDEVMDAVNRYQTYFKSENNQSGVPTETPLDYFSEYPVIFLFQLKRDNWKFTDHTQFSISNIPDGCSSEDLCEVIGQTDDGRGLFVKYKCWMDKDANGNDVYYPVKYNLHITIFQDVKTFDAEGNPEKRPMKTDIIIDPGMNSNSGSGPLGP